MKLISRNELRSLLLAQTSATIVSLVSCIEPDLKAKDVLGERNPYMRGLKLSDGFTIGKVNKINGRVDTDYQREVTNQVTKEIEAQRVSENLPPLDEAEMNAELDRRIRFGTSWHRPIIVGERFSALSVNKKSDDEGDAYLRIIVGSQGRHEYVALDGSTVPNEAAEPFEKSYRDAYANQGAEQPRQMRTYALASIVEIRINGEIYRVAENFTDKPLAMRERVWEIAEEYLLGERTMAKV